VIPSEYTIRSLNKLLAPVREVGDQFKIGPDILVTFGSLHPETATTQPNPNPSMPNQTDMTQSLLFPSFAKATQHCCFFFFNLLHLLLHIHLRSNPFLLFLLYEQLKKI
jgi:hypothetical protein